MGTIIGDGITFDDVLLVPGYSDFTGVSDPVRFYAKQGRLIY